MTNPRPRGRDASRFFAQTLARYRDRTTEALLRHVPESSPPYLYDLVGTYPRRLGKGLRAATCLATCAALGGSERSSLNSAVAIELFHNAFLIHDDVQDQSLSRRGGATLAAEFGPAIAVNVGNAANVLALQRLIENRMILGAPVSARVVAETERMLTHTLEGQSLELAWIRDNVCELEDADYLQMCLKKTSWYSFIYPMRVGALIAEGTIDHDRFCRFGWYLGAAFQIQDDVLNLTGSYAQYGKELYGDLWEGKRTLMLIHLLAHARARERRRVVSFLAKSRAERDEAEVAWIYAAMLRHGSVDAARRSARQLAGAALIEGLSAFAGVPESAHKRFIFEMILYVVRRRR